MGEVKHNLRILLQIKAVLFETLVGDAGGEFLKMPDNALIPEHVHVGPDNRITLPKRFCDVLPWIKGAEANAWLYLMEPGRYRLLSDNNVQTDPILEAIRTSLLPEVRATPTQASDFEPSEDVAMMARLVPVTLKLHTGSWRLSLPEDWNALAPPDCNPGSISFLISPRGFVEIWHTDMLRNLLTPTWKRKK